MPILFDHHTMNDRYTAQTVEEGIRVYGNWSGLHDFDFYTLFQADEIVAPASGEWNVTEVDQTVPYSMVLRYHVDAVAGHGVTLKTTEGGSYWLVGFDKSDHAIVRNWNGVEYTEKMNLPLTYPDEADMIVAFRELRFSDDETDIWHAVTVWCNDQLMFTYNENIGYPLSGEITVGVASMAAGGHTFTDVEIPQLTEFSEWSSLDPGEAPMGGLQRSIDGRYVKFYSRWDGSIRAWRPKETASIRTFTQGEAEVREESSDLRQLYNHVRMMGAYEQAEYIRPDLLAKHGHRFVETSNPYLMSANECYEQARLETYRMEEQAINETIVTSYTPLIEPEDHVTTPSGERIVTARRWTVTPPQVEQELNVRKYTEAGS